VNRTKIFENSLAEKNLIQTILFGVG